MELEGRHGRGRWVLGATILGSAMVFLDGSAVNVLLPVLQAEFQAVASDVQWIVEAQRLFFASLLLLGGALGDRFGRRRMFLTGLGLFVAGALGAGAAPALRWLIGARALQGIGAALLAPSSLALITASFPGERRGQAIGFWASMTAITSAAGPLLAGVLADHASWRWVFLLHVPLGVAVAWTALARVPESRNQEAGRLDVAGAAAVTLGLGGMVLALVEGQRLGWTHPLVLGSGVVGLLSLGAFLAVERRVEDPLLPLVLFENRTLSGANLATFFVYASLAAVLFFVPLNLVQVQGFSPTQAGAGLLPFVLVMALLAPLTGRLADRVGPRWPITGGALVAAAGAALLTRPGASADYWTTFLPALFTLGLGMALLVPAVTSAALGAAPQERVGLASGLNNAVARTGGLMAIAVLGATFTWQFGASLARGIAGVALPAGAREAILSQRDAWARLEPPSGLGTEARQAVASAVEQAFIEAFQLVAWVGAGLYVVGAVVAWWMVRGVEG